MSTRSIPRDTRPLPAGWTQYFNEEFYLSSADPGRIYYTHPSGPAPFVEPAAPTPSPQVTNTDGDGDATLPPYELLPGENETVLDPEASISTLSPQSTIPERTIPSPLPGLHRNASLSNDRQQAPPVHHHRSNTVSGGRLPPPLPRRPQSSRTMPAQSYQQPQSPPMGNSYPAHPYPTPPQSPPARQQPNFPPLPPRVQARPPPPQRRSMRQSILNSPVTQTVLSSVSGLTGAAIPVIAGLSTLAGGAMGTMGADFAATLEGISASTAPATDYTTDYAQQLADQFAAQAAIASPPLTDYAAQPYTPQTYVPPAIDYNAQFQQILAQQMALQQQTQPQFTSLMQSMQDSSQKNNIALQEYIQASANAQTANLLNAMKQNNANMYGRGY